MNAAFTPFLEHMETIVRRLEEHRDRGERLINDAFMDDFVDGYRKAEKNAQSILDTNRDMKIGIVGQVKAGKSSFLNALVFDGNDLLPRAATPMTAALTKIRYAERSYANVHFYSEEDWAYIERTSDMCEQRLAEKIRQWKEDQERLRRQRTGKMEKLRNSVMAHTEAVAEPTEQIRKRLYDEISERYRSCHELVETAKEKEVSPSSVIGQTREISVTDIKGDLMDYVGAHGNFTPYVKFIEIGLQNELLRNLEIVDTPGLDDPIVSRTVQTTQFLQQCDLVFVLSPTPQFLNRNEMDFIVKTLPRESIRHAILVGSKFDSVLLDDPGRTKKNIVSAVRETRRKLDNSAHRIIDGEAGNADGDAAARMLRKLKEHPIYYVSSILYGIGKKKRQGLPLNEEEEHILGRLHQTFEGVPDDVEFFLSFANIDGLREKEFQKIRMEKENIIREKSAEFVKDQYREFLKQLDEMQQEAEQNQRILQSSDISGLEKELEHSRHALLSMNRSIKDIFAKCGREAYKYLAGVAVDIRAETKDYQHINVNSESRSHERSRTTGWFIFKKTHYYTVTENYKTASVSDVLNNIDGYITDAERKIIQQLNNAVDIHAVKNEIKDNVLRAFQESGSSFHEQDILGPVDNILHKLTIPRFSIVNREAYQQFVITDFYGAQVEGQDIHRLAMKQTETLQKIAQDVSDQLEKIATEFEQHMETWAIHFLDDTQKAIQAKIDLLQNNLKNKEENMKCYDAFIADVQRWKDELRREGV